MHLIEKATILYLCSNVDFMSNEKESHALSNLQQLSQLSLILLLYSYITRSQCSLLFYMNVHVTG